MQEEAYTAYLATNLATNPVDNSFNEKLFNSYNNDHNYTGKDLEYLSVNKECPFAIFVSNFFSESVAASEKKKTTDKKKKKKKKKTSAEKKKKKTYSEKKKKKAADEKKAADKKSENMKDCYHLTDDEIEEIIDRFALITEVIEKNNNAKEELTQKAKDDILHYENFIRSIFEDALNDTGLNHSDFFDIDDPRYICYMKLYDKFRNERKKVSMISLKFLSKLDYSEYVRRNILLTCNLDKLNHILQYNCTTYKSYLENRGFDHYSYLEYRGFTRETFLEENGFTYDPYL